MDVYNQVMSTGWFPNVMQQTMIRAQTKLEFAWGVATRMTEAVGGLQPPSVQMLGELWSYGEFARSCIRMAEENAYEFGNGVWFPHGAPMTALKSMLPSWFPRVNEIIRLLGSHNLLAAPTAAQPGNPELRSLIDRYCMVPTGSTPKPALDSFAWPGISRQRPGSRGEQYERFWSFPALDQQLAHTIADRSGRPACGPFPEGKDRPPQIKLAEAVQITAGAVLRLQASGIDRSLDRRQARRLEGEVADFSPVDGSHLADVSAGGKVAAEAAVAVARKAFPAWVALGPKGRLPILKFAEGIKARASELAAVETMDNGSLLMGNVHRVVPRAAQNIEFFADWALTLDGHSIDSPEVVNHVRYDPAGVAVLITPWNAPLMLTTWKVGPALAAGNTVVVKPPEWAPLTCSLMADIAHRGPAARRAECGAGIGEVAGDAS